jgi:3'-5' exoribonuclease
MGRLPRITELAADSVGWGFYLCARKEVRTGRSGEYLSLMLQDASGEIRAKVFQEVEVTKREFDAGEFVKIQGRGNSFNQQLELVLDKIRRVMPERDASDGFREEDCIRCAPRPASEMWAELMAHVDGLADLDLRELLRAMLAEHGDRMKIWPAARQVHHAYRSGLLEHVLQLIGVASFLADRYGARRDLVIAGAILHDIGKLQELTYDLATGYSVEGNLVGHIALGLGMVRDAIRERPAFPPALALELEHLILSHHGSRELGSPVEPMTIEAFILAATDDLDAKIQQIRQHLADDDSEGPFTSYHRRLERVFLKPPQTPKVLKS